MTLPLPPRLMLRNGTYYFRICIPKDIVSVIGRRLIVRSLRTSDLKLARAKLPYFIVAAESEFDALRTQQRGMAVEETVGSTATECLDLGQFCSARGLAHCHQSVGLSPAITYR